MLLGLLVAYKLSPKLYQIAEKNEIKYYLKEFDKYKAITPPITDRDFWDSIPEKPPQIPPNESLNAYDKLRVGTAQELSYNKGEWIPLIESAIEKLTKNPWLDTQRFDKPLVGWINTINAAQLAFTIESLKGRINPEIAERVKNKIKEEIINPYMTDLTNFQTRKLNWHKDYCPWLDIDSNWRAVCIANILFAGLIVEEDIDKRAHLLETSIEQMELYLKTFEKDGYLPAGIRYWNWGFKHYVLLAERILHATGGNINLYDNEILKKIVEFQLRWNLEAPLELENANLELGDENPPQRRVNTIIDDSRQFYPTFGDNSNPASSLPQIRYILAHRFDTPYSGRLEFDSNSDLSGPFYSAALTVSDIKTEKQKLGNLKGDYLLEGLKAGIIRDSTGRNALTIKGGHNAEEHNHNDLGGYTLFQSKNPLSPWKYVTGDAGFGSYTKGNFEKGKRYTFPLLSSYGHPVPVVDNTLQSDGLEYMSKEIISYSTPKKFHVEYDLKGAYDCPKILSLIRSITYEKETSILTVKDSFKASSPIKFESPIIIGSKATRVENGWSFEVDGEKFVFEASASPKARPNKSIILSNFRDDLYRISIESIKPSLEGFIEYKISTIDTIGKEPKLPKKLLESIYYMERIK